MTAELRWRLFHAWLFTLVSQNLTGALWAAVFPSASTLLTLTVSTVVFVGTFVMFLRMGREPAWLREALA